MAEGCVTTEAAGQEIVLMPHRAVFWPAGSALLVADLHLGKGETLAAGGIPVPRRLGERDLARLADAVRATGARRVLVLGDLLHAGVGLVPPLIDAVADWRVSLGAELWIVPGNHDRHLRRVADAWRLTLCDHILREGPFEFVHDPADAAHAASFTWAGHVHPLARLRAGGDSLSLPCYLIDRTLGLLPAFSSFTAGVAVVPSPHAGVWAVADGAVVELPARPRRLPA